MSIQGRIVGLLIAFVWSCAPKNYTARAQASGSADATSVKIANICQDGGVDLRCPVNRLVNIEQIVCGYGEHACASRTNETLYRLCHRHRSCDALALKNTMGTYCQNKSKRSHGVQVLFRCVPGPSSKCRTNVCKNDNSSLSCPRGGVIHVYNVSCSDGKDNCSWETYITLYTLCEGETTCASAGLRTLMSSYCNNPVESLRNVFVDYMCLPDNKLVTSCSTQYKTLTEPFGVILRPTDVTQKGPQPERCTWLINLKEGQRSTVVVHLAYSQRGLPGCTSQFLIVRYTDCATGEVKVGSYCDLRKVNQRLQSCGNVSITSWLPSTTRRMGDRFLVSYEVLDSKGKRLETLNDMPSCGLMPVVASRSMTSTPSTRTGGRNYGPSDSMFDHSNGDKGENGDIKTSGDSDKVTLQFKLIALYIFFGIVIVALILALVFVIVSYRGISQKGRYEVDTSEKQALWKRDDTPLETFRHNSLAEVSSSMHTESADVNPDSDDGRRVVATVHVDSPSDDEMDKRASTGSGFSSFLPKREYWGGGNPYASYCSLPDNDVDAHDKPPSGEVNGQVKNILEDKSSDRYQPLEVNRRQPQPSSHASNGIEHCTINDDDYAIVRKPRKKPRDAKNCRSVEDDPTYDNLCEPDIIGFRPTSGPYDRYRNSGSDNSFRNSGSDMNFRFSDPNGWVDDY